MITSCWRQWVQLWIIIEKQFCSSLRFAEESKMLAFPKFSDWRGDGADCLLKKKKKMRPKRWSKRKYRGVKNRDLQLSRGICPCSGVGPVGSNWCPSNAAFSLLVYLTNFFPSSHPDVIIRRTSIILQLQCVLLQ